MKTFAALVVVSLCSQVLADTTTRTVPGTSRKYDLYRPENYEASKTYPLVVAFHAYGRDRQSMAADTKLNEKADSAAFLIAYPDGTGSKRSWNAGACCNQTADDVAFVEALLKDVATTAKIDSDRIYAVGMSNGAMMAYRVACELDEMFAAAAGVAGTMVASPCSPTRSIPILHIHGTEDRIVKYDGSASELLPQGTTSVAKHVDFWVTRNKSKLRPKEDTIQTMPFRVARKTFAAQRTGTAEVVLITVHGGGHLWPGQPRPADLPKELFGETAQNVSANDEIWTFLSKHKLP